jgi:hypothetical protein
VTEHHHSLKTASPASPGKWACTWPRVGGENARATAGREAAATIASWERLGAMLSRGEKD